ncbi:MAG TPA: L,D-transpeptidase family protein [Candidatus Paceibacterota bacterium]|nr:L,D-transpeptidase family protein [Verrucomicrobiota bacterium]HRY47821.1 L,D-transpeptidase family protein [Candidatus Paceibacterota bacterium]
MPPRRKKTRRPRERVKASREGWLWPAIIAAAIGAAIWYGRQPSSVPLPKQASPQTIVLSNDPRTLTLWGSNGLIGWTLPEDRQKPDPKPSERKRESLTNYPFAIPTNTFDPLISASRPTQNLLEAQIALARIGISSGSIDGRLGSQTRAALRVFQRNAGIPATGQWDDRTRALLQIHEPVFSEYRVEAWDLKRLMPLPETWLEKSEQKRLDYETLLECIAEQSWTHPQLIQRLNPNLISVTPEIGMRLKIPCVKFPRVTEKAAELRIYLEERCLQALDARSNILAHFPCSIARQTEKRPLGLLRIRSILPNPHYVFDPAIFPESEEGRILGRKLVLPPGPNNPVGSVWLGLDKPGYGIHGTPRPEDVGRTESHGCFRLANWNVEFLVSLVNTGTPVRVFTSASGGPK